VVSHASRHCWRDSQAAVNPNEVVVCEIEPERRNKIFDTFGKSVRKPSQPAQERSAIQVVGRNLTWL
jgi:hypothetical protein